MSSITENLRLSWKVKRDSVLQMYIYVLETFSWFSHVVERKTNICDSYTKDTGEVFFILKELIINSRRATDTFSLSY